MIELIWSNPAMCYGRRSRRDGNAVVESGSGSGSSSGSGSGSASGTDDLTVSDEVCQAMFDFAEFLRHLMSRSFELEIPGQCCNNFMIRFVSIFS
jgi:hypothetical protein